MRVLVVTSLYPTPAHPERGRFVYDQVEALRAIEGVDIEVFSFEPGWRNYAPAARALRARHRGTPFDVVHAHHGLGGWTARALGKRPLVVTFHGTDLAHKLVGPLSRVLTRTADLPATVSASLARERLPGAEGIGVLPCGVDLDRFRRIDRREARRRIGVDPDGRYLLFPAAPARPEKRHERAVALAAALDGVRLLHYEAVDPGEVPYWINAADAMIVTSEREGFGLAALEALACDVPVVSTPVGIAPLALSGIEGCAASDFDVGRWSELLRPHLEAGDPRVGGRSRAALFDRDRMAARVFEAYRALV
jgi:glycosyltransferase involved in cell wall biosynthesis